MFKPFWLNLESFVPESFVTDVFKKYNKNSNKILETKI
ncbi:hypothetical protein D083_2000 [Dickeya solani RNS 08.23.3.1.A]|nr:hypothetical protein D083_2000 [Dickeya solani RNS 08.23.3.1.A]